ncbi:hypothetical protein [Fimbriiglobus ruber]|uniref:DUF4139 domain-containing protein n=1 Tax=Fimbriiglobus ruber TaxID=1908690 RepID=A0A225DR11_9BACT|nr:hypothetical protein [Fimbriiglobus ruber]OWK43533.1 hypothetical protein FRUB_03132 [Fimbriiglobus ruber]
MSTLPIRRVVLYKHGVGFFEREATVTGDQAVTLTFKQREVSDVLKSLTVLDANGGVVSAVSYDSTTPVEQLLAEIAINIPDGGSLVALLPQLKGARVAVRPTAAAGQTQGVLLGIDTVETRTPSGVAKQVRVSVLGDGGDVRTFDLFDLDVQILDDGIRRDLDYYLKTQLASKKKDARTFTLFTQGTGERTLRVSYLLEAPVWKATYRMLLGEPLDETAAASPPENGEGHTRSLIQGWAVVDNTSDEDWDLIDLTLVAGLPVSFTHDLYTPRYIKRPVVAVQETTGVLPPMAETGEEFELLDDDDGSDAEHASESHITSSHTLQAQFAGRIKRHRGKASASAMLRPSGVSSVATQTRERQVGDLFEYTIDKPVTVRRNQSALVPIVLKPFAGRAVLLYQKHARPENPIRCVEFENTTGLTLEGGPVTVLDAGSYVGEAMLDTLKPGEKRLVGYAVELAVRATDKSNIQTERVTRVLVRGGTVQLYSAQSQITTYTFVGNADKEQVLYVDHPRGGPDWNLVEPAKPHEITDNYWRLKITLPPKTTTKLLVHAQRPIEEKVGLIDSTDTVLGYWLERKYFDKEVAQAIRAIFETRQRDAAAQEQIQRFQKEREKIHAEQKRIRENLAALGDRPSEKELRERLVRTLTQQEDRLEEIDRDTHSLQVERDGLRSELTEKLDKLEYEGTVIKLTTDGDSPTPDFSGGL